MQRIERKEYLDNIGINRLFCNTDLGNKIYILNNGQKYKKFSPDYSDLRYSVNREFKQSLIEQTEEYGHSIVSFPQIVISSDKWVSGVICDFEEGYKLRDIPLDTEIDYLLHIIDYLEKGIENISLKGWVFEDLHEENVMINENNTTRPVRIIDTDFYQKESYRDEIMLLQNYKDNLARIFDAIMVSILPRIDRTTLWNDESIALAYNKAVSGELKCTEFLKMLLFKIKINQKTIRTLRKTIYQL